MAATKAYVLSLTESLSEEFKGMGVSITALLQKLLTLKPLRIFSETFCRLTSTPPKHSALNNSG